MESTHESTAHARACWRKSSRSANNAYCVEVAVAEQAVAVRDTKDRAGGTLSFTRRSWTTFVETLAQC